MQNRQCVIIAAVLLGLVATSGAVAEREETGRRVNSASHEEQAALNCVAQRIAGYNAHDIDAFLAAHAEQVRIYEFPEKEIGQGRAHLKRIFEPQFDREQGHVEVMGQFVIGNKVVSYEHVTVGQHVERLVTVYTVENGVIASFRLIESNE